MPSPMRDPTVTVTRTTSDGRPGSRHRPGTEGEPQEECRRHDRDERPECGPSARQAREPDEGSRRDRQEQALEGDERGGHDVVDRHGWSSP
jgi:hypothetical protein